MTAKQKQIIAGLSIAIVSATGTLAVAPKDKVVQIQEDNKIVYEMPQAEYDTLKSLLFAKMAAKETFSYNEYQILVKVLDSEIKEKGGIELQDLKKGDDVLDLVTEAVIP